MNANVRFARCSHGTYFLSVGPATVALTQEDLVAVARSVYRAAEDQPQLLMSLVAGIRQEQVSLSQCEKQQAARNN